MTIDELNLYEEKNLCVLLVDHSEASANKIKDINQFLHNLYKDIVENDFLYSRIEIALISCNKATEIIQQPTLVENFVMPTLKAEGSTNLIDGIKKAVEVVEERKQYYREQGIAYKRPWIIIISSGKLTADFLKNNLKQIISIRDDAVINKRYSIQPIAFDEDADMNVIDSIATSKVILMKDVKFPYFFMRLIGSFGHDD